MAKRYSVECLRRTGGGRLCVTPYGYVTGHLNTICVIHMFNPWTQTETNPPPPKQMGSNQTSTVHRKVKFDREYFTGRFNMQMDF